MRLKGKQLDGFNAALREDNQEKAMVELQGACARAEGIVPFASARGSAAFVRIIELCEEHQNADIEGKEPEWIMSESDKLVALILGVAADALEEQKQVPPNVES